MRHAIAHFGPFTEPAERARRQRRREYHDLTVKFWAIATPACLLFWAAVAYGIHSAI